MITKVYLIPSVPISNVSGTKKITNCIVYIVMTKKLVFFNFHR